MKTLHKFSCRDEGHEFYLDLKMPVPVTEFAQRMHDLTCPDCQSDSIDMDFNPVQVLEVGKQ